MILVHCDWLWHQTVLQPDCVWTKLTCPAVSHSWSLTGLPSTWTTAADTETDSCQHWLKPVCVCVSQSPHLTLSRSHTVMFGGINKKPDTWNTKEPRSAFAAHRQNCPRRPPTLPVTAETAALYCQWDHSVSFCPALLLLRQKPIPRLAAPARGEALENRAEFVCSGSPLPTGLLFFLIWKSGMTHFTASFIMGPFSLFRRASTMPHSGHMETFTTAGWCVWSVMPTWSKTLLELFKSYDRHHSSLLGQKWERERAAIVQSFPNPWHMILHSFFCVCGWGPKLSLIVHSASPLPSPLWHLWNCVTCSEVSFQEDTLDSGHREMTSPSEGPNCTIALCQAAVAKDNLCLWAAATDVPVPVLEERACGSRLTIGRVVQFNTPSVLQYCPRAVRLFWDLCWPTNTAHQYFFFLKKQK